MTSNMKSTPKGIFGMQSIYIVSRCIPLCIVSNSRGWKLNNLTSVGHYVLGVSCNYSLFF